MSKVVSVMSASGGQGKSVLAAYLCAALAEDSRSRVLVIDGGAGAGSLSWLLGEDINIAYDLGDVLGRKCELEDAVVRCKCGCWLMPAASDDSPVTADALAGLLEVAAGVFDWVLIDCNTVGVSDGAVIASVCDVNLICSHADRLRLSGASWLRRALPEEDDRCRLVICQFSAKERARGECESIDRAIDTVGARLIGVVPYSPDITAYGQSEGLAKAPCVRTAARNIAARLRGEDIALQKLS